MLLALWLEHRFTKDQILEIYLNRVYLGAGAYGVDAAARALFRQIGGEADAVRERRHRRADPGAEPAQPGARPRGRGRARAEVLNDMVEAGFITRAQADAAEKRGFASVPNSRPGSRYFADWVAEQIRELAGTGRARPDRAHDAGPAAPGDRRERRWATYWRDTAPVIASGRARWSRWRRTARCGRWSAGATTEAASSTARPRRSASPARRSSRSSISPGSKPACVRRTASSMRRSASATGSRTIIPNRYQGEMTLATALAQSVNTVAAQVAQRAGIGHVIATANRLGIGSELAPDASLALGTNEVNLLELVSAYAPFANGGNGRARLRHHRYPGRRREDPVPPRRNRAGARDRSRAGRRDEPDAGRRNHLRHRQKRGAGASGRRQDRHDAGIPRRLVYRLHGRSGRRRLARERRQHADEQGDRRHAAGRRSGAISCCKRRATSRCGNCPAARPYPRGRCPIRVKPRRSIGCSAGLPAPRRRPAMTVIPDRRRTIEALRRSPSSGQAALLQQRRDLGVAAAEGAVERHRVLGVAGAVDRLQPRRQLRIERVAFLLEGGEAVGVEHLRPHIGIVSGRIAAAGEQVLEMRRTVAQADFRRHADFREKIPLERLDIEPGRIGPRMQVEVQQRAGRVFDRGKTLVEIARGEQPFEQRLGQRLAGAVVPGVAAQVFRHVEPVLEDLRRELDKVAAHRRARLRRIAHPRQQPVQPVAEFVEQRARVVEAEQRRLAFREIVVVDNNRQHLAVERLLHPVAAHPGA